MLVAGCDSGLSAVALRHDPALRFDALEVFGEELLHRAVEVETVLLVVEAVAFVVLDHVVHMLSLIHISMGNVAVTPTSAPS